MKNGSRVRCFTGRIQALQQLSGQTNGFGSSNGAPARSGVVASGSGWSFRGRRGGFGGGRGGGGGGSSGGSVCDTCGEHGRFAGECPSAADVLNVFNTESIVGGAYSDVELSFLKVVQRVQKRQYLCHIVNAIGTIAGTTRVLVFVEQKRNADFLACLLSQTGYPTTTIHEDRLQREREEALGDFKSAKTPVMIVTHRVSTRNLDIPDVGVVINYDLPTDIDKYVLRIRRIGRCGNLGKVTSFYSHETDFALAADLVNIVHESNPKTKRLPTFQNSESKNNRDKKFLTGWPPMPRISVKKDSLTVVVVVMQTAVEGLLPPLMMRVGTRGAPIFSALHCHQCVTVERYLFPWSALFLALAWA